MSEIQASRYAAENQPLADNLPGQQLDWLQQLRATALTKFSQQGFPSPRAEEWRYTNVSAIEKKQFSAAIELTPQLLDEQWLSNYQLADTFSLVFINGRFSAMHSQLDDLPKNVIVSNMANALQQHPDLVKAKFGQALANEDHGFIHFNTAWFGDGLFVYMPENTRLPKPVQFLHVVTQADMLATTRNLLIAETSAEFEFIETYVGQADLAYLCANVNEIFIAPNAQITASKIQIEADKAFHFGGSYVKQERDARFIHHSFSFGSLLTRNEVHTDLGHAAECELNGLYLGNKRQVIDNHTRINHLQPHAISRETYKGILDQRSRGVFQGRVVVAEDAQKTDSEMNNRNLLLSDTAEADTKPQLEIYADDVKCAHGVTVGQLDEKSIFYLQSRSIDAETARNMLTFAFANEMLAKVQRQSLHDMLLDQLLVQFPQSGMRKEWL